MNIESNQHQSDSSDSDTEDSEEEESENESVISSLENSIANSSKLMFTALLGLSKVI